MSGHTLEAQEYRKLLIEKVRAQQDAIADALINAALNPKSSGQIIALKEIHERVLGKVTQPVAVNVEELRSIQSSLAKLADLANTKNAKPK